MTHPCVRHTRTTHQSIRHISIQPNLGLPRSRHCVIKAHMYTAHTLPYTGHAVTDKLEYNFLCGAGTASQAASPAQITSHEIIGNKSRDNRSPVTG